MSQTILLADDEPAVLSYLRTILCLEGFEIYTATDGQAAWEQVETGRCAPDLLVTDIRMPRMDGIALARRFNQRFPAAPVLFLSGFPFDMGEEQTRYPAGSQVFLAKPFNRQQLLEAVRRCLPAGSAASTTS